MPPVTQRDDHGIAEPVVIGKIVGLFGVKGWVKIRSYTDPREQIADYQPWRVVVAGEWSSFEVETVKPQGKSLVARLAGIADRDAAMRLLNGDIVIDRSQLPVLKENEFYWRDLQGLQVLNLQGVELGTVKSLFETGANDVLVVRKDGGPEILIPCVMDRVIHTVDIESGIIRVDWEADF
ncbi:MAG TPA: ribosome maturation factor RimM [Gammaproteobacteria bacterium]|nr:ribosome maturation factor RimM [Gammaproteobacteria bacterium]